MKRNTYTQEFKQQIIKEAIETGNCSIVARRYDINPNVLARWVRENKNGGTLSSSTNNIFASPDTKQVEVENEKLKKLLGEKELENQILRELIKKSNPHLLKKLK